MQNILIKNIKGLAGILENNQAALRGANLNELQQIENAFLAIENGKIAYYGKMEEMAGINDWRNLEIIDAEGKFVIPAYCDSHSHIVFAKYRETEFVDRINGLTYEEIGEKGGGILNSANNLANLSEDELFESAMERLELVKSFGTGAIEIKSGYGLTVTSELKILRVIKRLKEASDLTIKATFLGAHAFPAEFKENNAGYIRQIIDEMLPVIEAENLADYIDVFCERNYFSPEQLDEILAAGVKHGLKPKIHVNQFSILGGVEIGVKHGAVSVDHLEEFDENDTVTMSKANTIATALPSCSFFLGIPYSPVKKMLKNNIAVALASDYNPGSTPSGNMQFVNSLACIQMKLTPEEALNSTTINGAYAMELGDEMGSITIGKKANLIITKKISSLAYIPYSFGENCVERIILSK
ncbi:imidazolonepropionase [Putridiphycobacter roseus]|uniref:Imidazolonepropionase n=1 Tax=Putridiphycobacter roseus TaxID=2219161 RepID=A0A2W1NPR7_9FLAO|nr:imidazolonepropionase [Putridiphycobacter roseus]PZE16628.1 imidazolonepropionase [Putridiphycobacter roseus]